MADSQKETMTRLGLLGLIPFAVGAAGAWLSPWLLPGGISYDLGEVTLIYTAAVASFIVGAGAGGMLAKGGLTRDYARSGVIAALLAWLAAWPTGALYISLPYIARYAIAIGVFIYLFLHDRRAVASGALPAWYGALRARLTFWTCLFLTAIISRLIV